MTSGIYMYLDKKTSEIVYIGKDSYINRDTRHKAHLNPIYYDKQHINKILQNNINRYEYNILYEGNFNEYELNCFEIELISIFNPIFNFTKGGDGQLGSKWSNERKKEHSKRMKELWANNEYREKTCEKFKKAANKPEWKEKQRKRMIGNKYAEGPQNVSEEGYNQKLKNLEKGRLPKKYARIVKEGFNSTGNQVYCLKFKGKRLKRSVNKDKLLNWFLKEYPLEIIKMEE